MSVIRPFLALAAGTALAFGAVAAPATAAPAPAVAPATAATGAVTALPGPLELQGALLAVDDVGSQFTEVPVEENTTPDEAPAVTGCEDLVALIRDLTDHVPFGTDQASVELTGPEDNPVITETLFSVPADQLTPEFVQVSEAFRDCTSFTLGEGFGEITFDVTPVTLGDRPEAPAIRLDSTFLGVSLNGYVALEQFGPVAMAYTFFQTDATSQEAAATHYRTAVAKAERVLDTPAGSTADDVGSAA